MSIKSGLKKVFNRVVFGAWLGIYGFLGVAAGSFKAMNTTTQDVAEKFEKKIERNAQPSLAEAKAFQEQKEGKCEALAGLIFLAAGLGLAYSGLSKEEKTAVLKFF